MVWISISNGYLIDSYFFNDNRFNYLHFLQHELIGLLENIDLETKRHVVLTRRCTSTFEQNSSRSFKPNISR